jgi:hypothetical protein
MIVIKNLPDGADFGWVVEVLKRALGEDIIIEQV